MKYVMRTVFGFAIMMMSIIFVQRVDATEFSNIHASIVRDVREGGCAINNGDEIFFKSSDNVTVFCMVETEVSFDMGKTWKVIELNNSHKLQFPNKDGVVNIRTVDGNETLNFRYHISDDKPTFEAASYVNKVKITPTSSNIQGYAVYEYKHNEFSSFDDYQIRKDCKPIDEFPRENFAYYVYAVNKNGVVSDPVFTCSLDGVNINLRKEKFKYTGRKIIPDYTCTFNGKNITSTVKSIYNAKGGGKNPGNYTLTVKSNMNGATGSRTLKFKIDKAYENYIRITT